MLGPVLRAKNWQLAPEPHTTFGQTNDTADNADPRSRIEIVPYDPGWPAAFEAEASRLRAALKTLALRIDHHGSTAIPGLGAKPIIDIQVSVAALQPLSAYRRKARGHRIHSRAAS